MGGVDFINKEYRQLNEVYTKMNKTIVHQTLVDFLPGIFFDVGLYKLDKNLLSFCFRTVNIRAGQGDSCDNVPIDQYTPSEDEYQLQNDAHKEEG